MFWGTISINKIKGIFMICPNCNKKVELTTKKYFKSLLGNYICPDCSSKFKLKRTKIYFLWIFLSIIIVILSSLFIINSITNKEFLNVTYFSWLIVLFFLYTYIDRKIENSMPTQVI
jgi:pilus assembly protein TadC